MSNIPIVSSRKKFYRARQISSKDKVKIVNLSDPRPSNNKAISIESLLQSIKGKKVIVLVHGYNNTFDEVCDAYLRITNQININSIPHDQIIGYVWPGGDKKISYFSARRRAKKLSSRISYLLESLIGSAKSVDIVAHSLGCFLSLSTLNKSKSVKLNNFYMMAPAVKNFMISNGNYFSGDMNKCERVFVFKSNDDSVLRLAFVAGEGTPALGFTGPEPFRSVVKNCIVVDCSGKPDPIEHGSYSRRTEIYCFIRKNLNLNNFPVEVKL